MANQNLKLLNYIINNLRLINMSFIMAQTIQKLLNLKHLSLKKELAFQ